MANKIIPILVVIALGVGALFLFMNRGFAPTSEVEENTSETVETTGVEEVVTEGANTSTTEPEPVQEAQSEIKEFFVDGTNFAFSPKTIRVKKGDIVRIHFTSKSGHHDLKIDEFDVATDMLDSGGSDTIEFVADKSGTFEYYCSIGQHRAMGMVGSLIVEE